MADQRQQDVQDFYTILSGLEKRLGGPKKLADCSGRMPWPMRGVYFFFEDGENRRESGTGLRVVRIGTHALSEKSRTTLWKRLSQHRGVVSTGGGNHRGSIFRRHIGNALAQRDPRLTIPTWVTRRTAPAEIRKQELPLERMVSQTICAMPFLWIDIGDMPGPASDRGYIERNAIALLSNHKREQIDPPSSNWLGHFCPSERVRCSGLWNSNHVDETYDRDFLNRFESLVLATMAS
jgi:hypothetical protein